jgi:hypothetical protein
MRDVLLDGRWIDWDRDSNGGSDKCGGIPVDSLITTAARALAAGRPLSALKSERGEGKRGRVRYGV